MDRKGLFELRAASLGFRGSSYVLSTRATATREQGIYMYIHYTWSICAVPMLMSGANQLLWVLQTNTQIVVDSMSVSLWCTQKQYSFNPQQSGCLFALQRNVKQANPQSTRRTPRDLSFRSDSAAGQPLP
jgi:hypothetical protein